jgi:hypothetical protein
MFQYCTVLYRQIKVEPVIVGREINLDPENPAPVRAAEILKNPAQPVKPPLSAKKTQNTLI